MSVMVGTEARVEWSKVQKIAPEIMTALGGITKALAQSGLEDDLLELIKVRASQLNHCAFCVQYHLNEARKLGMDQPKLDLLTAWREAGIYSAREAAALAWTEAITLAAQQPVSDDDYAHVTVHFSERELVYLTAAIGQINFWNRIAAPFRFTPPVPRSA